MFETPKPNRKKEVEEVKQSESSRPAPQKNDVKISSHHNTSIEKLEADIASLEQEKKEILEKLSLPLPISELTKLSERLNVIEVILPLREEEWVKLSTAD